MIKYLRKWCRKECGIVPVFFAFIIAIIVVVLTSVYVICKLTGFANGWTDLKLVLMSLVIAAVLIPVVILLYNRFTK